MCHGVGWVQPLLADGKTNYSDAITCQVDGCLASQKRAFESTEAFIKTKGVNRFSTFESLEPALGITKALEAFRDIAINPDAPPLLIVYGVTGNGKTHLCEASVIEFLKRGVDCRMWAVADLVSELKQSIAENTTDSLVSRLKTMPALILDEWGQQYGTLWEEQKLEEIVIARDRADLITIITSNKELDGFPDRLVSRFSDSTKAMIVLNQAPDYRPKKKKKI